MASQGQQVKAILCTSYLVFRRIIHIIHFFNSKTLFFFVLTMVPLRTRLYVIYWQSIQRKLQFTKGTLLLFNSRPFYTSIVARPYMKHEYRWTPRGLKNERDHIMYRYRHANICRLKYTSNCTWQGFLKKYLDIKKNVQGTAISIVRSSIIHS